MGHRMPGDFLSAAIVVAVELVAAWPRRGGCAPGRLLARWLATYFSLSQMRIGLAMKIDE